MLLKGSCHCGAGRFTVESRTPYPYMQCYCSICRKTAGGGGYAINILGEADTLKVTGRKNLSVYRARVEDEKGRKILSPARRYFCSKCGSALWLADPRWKQWVYLFASAVDTPLPVAPWHDYVMLNYKAPWAEVPKRKHDRYFREFPREAIINWHKRHGLYEKE